MERRRQVSKSSTVTRGEGSFPEMPLFVGREEWRPRKTLNTIMYHFHSTANRAEAELSPCAAR